MGALSETMTSGYPFHAKILFRISAVEFDVGAVAVTLTSGHLEFESITTLVFPIRICIRCELCSGSSYG